MIELEGVSKFFGTFQALDGHQSAGRPAGGRRRDRAVGLGQVDDDPLHQPARGARRGPDRRRRRRADQRHPQHRGDPPRDRDGVPAVQPLPAHDGARQRHARPAPGAADAQGEGRGAGDGDARARAHPRAGEEVPRPAVRRPAAAGRHRPGAGDEAEGDAVRRADLGARPGDDQRGARHDEGPRPRRG